MPLLVLPLLLSTLQEELEQADAFLVIFSVVDKSSFTRAEQILTMLQDMDLLRSRAVILAANKIDLARSRAVSTQGLYTWLRSQPEEHHSCCSCTD